MVGQSFVRNDVITCSADVMISTDKIYLFLELAFAIFLEFYKQKIVD